MKPVQGSSLLSRRRVVVGMLFGSALSACGGGGGSDAAPSPPFSSPPPPAPAPGSKSFKRGIAYDLATAADMAALAPGVSWWYGWGTQPKSSLPADTVTPYGMDFVPMLWNDNFDAAAVTKWLKDRPAVKHLLLLNEPNLEGQATMQPAAAAALWPRYEKVAADTGVKLVGPQITYGTLSGYTTPVAWLDAFYAAYRAANAGRDPHIDYIGYHWYDYGLAGKLDELLKYKKPFWVTEFANWHVGDGSAAIDTVAKQKAQMKDMVATLEARADVYRYAWFTGRWNNDVHKTSLLGADGQLTELGEYYLSLPFSNSNP